MNAATRVEEDVRRGATPLISATAVLEKVCSKTSTIRLIRRCASPALFAWETAASLAVGRGRVCGLPVNHAARRRRAHPPRPASEAIPASTSDPGSGIELITALETPTVSSKVRPTTPPAVCKFRTVPKNPL